TGPALFIGLVAGNGLRIVDAEARPCSDDLSLAQADEWGVNPAGLSFDARLGRDSRERLVCANELLPAIRITARIEHIDADEDIACFEHLRPGECQRQQDGVTRRNIGHWNANRRLLWYGNAWIGQR